MADPTPEVGLPNTEWLEIKNVSSQALNIQGMRLAKPGGTLSGPMPSLVLAPDSAVVICTASQVAALSVFGRTVSVTSFPSLGNTADLIWLQNAQGEVIHAVDYTIAWYKNDIKADGGWTLEMIDSRFPCQGIENWTASVHPRGGTPGQPNSVARANADSRPPQLINAFANTATSITLTLNEPLLQGAGAAANYTVSDGVTVTTAVAQPPLHNQVLLGLGAALQAGRVYTVRVSNVADCAGNAIAAASEARVGLAQQADSLDVVVNELLFNPIPLANDYVELYNRSNKIIDLASLNIANRSSTSGNIGSITRLTANNTLLFPKEWVAFTADTAQLKQLFTVANPQNLYPIGLPSYPDDKGWVVLMNTQGAIIDELAYDQRWHFALVDNREGVALERISYEAPTNSRDNWTSAAKSSGFGTPTAQNSQHKAPTDVLQGEIVVEPRLFSPDNDGFEDFALIRFRLDQPGYVGNITIMDAAGRPVRVLQRNATLAQTGSFRWDGLGDKQQRLPVGTYIVYTEIFNLQGQKRTFKNTVAIARKF